MPSIKVRGLPPPQDHGHTAAGDGGPLGATVVDTEQLVDGILTADAAGRAKMALGYITDDRVNATASIAQSKLSLAITNAEVDPAANISKDKLASLAKTQLYHGDEIEVSVNGTIEEQVKDLAIIIDPTNGLDIKTLKVVTRIRTGNALYTAILQVYHDGGGVADLTLTSTSETYEQKSGSIDVSGWGTGRHTIEVKLASDGPAIWAYNELIEFYTVQ